MKNKINIKSQYEIITILIILLVIACIIIVWQIVSNVVNPKLNINITKTECVNEIGEYDGYLCNDGTAILDYAMYDEVRIGNKTCKAHWGNWSKEVCNEIEVDEIEYCTIDERIHPNITGFNFECRGDEKPYYHRNKKDITKKWLDENCDSCMANQEGQCLYYKCGDYEVTYG